MEIKINCTATDFLPISKLTNLQGNLKSLSKDNYEKLKNHILTFGFSSPFHVWKDGEVNYILDGTQRLRTLQTMQSEGCDLPNLPVTFINARDIKEARTILISLASTYGEVTNESLYEFMHLSEMPLELLQDHSYFPNIDYDKFAEYSLDLDNKDKYDESKEDDIPEVTQSICKLGDIWQLGNHRLLCGDCTVKENVDKLMNGEKADMVFTDPPYGVGYEQGKFTGIEVKNKFKPIMNDEKTGEELKAFIISVYKNIFDLCHEHAPIYVCSPSMTESLMILEGCKYSGFHMQSQIIWYKNQFILGLCDYHRRHEVVWYGYKGKNHFWCGDRTQDSVWLIKKDPHSAYVHPTQKPIELIEKAINNSSKFNNNILDLFGGSGSTLIACEKTNRKCFIMELDPHYCDVIIKRWEDYTGKKAEKISGDQS